jgi:L-ribulose-5-phosphate 3-epimerase
MPVLTMKRIKIGVDLASLGLPIRRGLQAAEQMGAAGVQVDAAGDLSPRVLSQTGRRELLHLCRSHNLELTALGCPLRHGLDSAEGQEARIENIRNVLSLSFDLQARIVVIQAGRIPQDSDDQRTRLMTEALLALGHHGDRTGTVLALVTGQEDGHVLKAFLERFDTGGLGVCLNPAYLLLNGFDPYESARSLRGRIVYGNAQDGRRTDAGRTGREVPLGHGEIDWMQYLSVLEEVEYRGWLTIRRETGENRWGDISAGIQFLRRLVGEE